LAIYEEEQKRNNILQTKASFGISEGTDGDNIEVWHLVDKHQASLKNKSDKYVKNDRSFNIEKLINAIDRSLSSDTEASS
jgi:hypothetical protein